jgi:hypothetical protein
MMQQKHTFALGITIGGILMGITTFAYAKQKTAWPKLDTLKNYPTQGKVCSLNGAASPNSNKAKSNQLKNRYKVPKAPPESLTVQDILKLPVPNAPSESAALPKSVVDENVKRYVSVVAYVNAVGVGGSGGESCNCNAKGSDDLVDTHIDIYGMKASHNSRNKVVVESTFRIRQLAKMGFLKSKIAPNKVINKDWSTDNLKKQLKGRKVRITGWLFYDSDHHREDWRSDKDDAFNKDGTKRKKMLPNSKKNTDTKNWRGTCWEIHPVMGLEVLP